MARIPSEASEIGVPEIVTPLPPAVIIWPSIEKAEAAAAAVKVWPATVKTEGVGKLRLTVELPMIATPEGAREMGVPAIVMAGPPGIRVDPATIKAVGLAVMAWPPTVKTSAEGPPGETTTTLPDGATEKT